MSSSSSGRAENRGRRFSFLTDFPPPDDFKKTLTQPTFHMLKGWWRGDSTVDTLATSPSHVFAYKNKGREQKKRRPREEREQNERGTKGRGQREETRRKRKEEKKKKKQKRKRKRKEKHRRLCRPQLPSSTAGHRKPLKAPPL
jgi:hypothetical protein